jgi:hypothetical protein
MVQFGDILKTVADNAEKIFNVNFISLNIQPSLHIHKEIKSAIEDASPAPTRTIHVQQINPQEEASVVSAPEGNAAPIPVPMPIPVRAVKTAQPSAPVRAVSAPEKKPVVAVSAPIFRKGVDPISIAISERDPMYEVASNNVKISIESEEARLIEGFIDQLYKNESGRSRGWVKSQLVEFIMPRAATGSDLNQKQKFQWDTVFTDKKSSAILDFICLAKGIRLAVWSELNKEIGIWPAADASNGDKIPNMYHVSSEGTILNNQTVFAPGYTVRAAYSVEHSLEKLTLSELNELAVKIGIPADDLSGKKTDRVKAIATRRTVQRLQANSQ